MIIRSSKASRYSTFQVNRSYKMGGPSLLAFEDNTQKRAVLIIVPFEPGFG